MPLRGCNCNPPIVNRTRIFCSIFFLLMSEWALLRDRLVIGTQ